MQQTARSQASQACRREAELLSDLNGEKGDPPGVLLGRLVLLCESEREGADTGSEKGLLGRYEIAGADASRERPGLPRAVKVGGDRGSDEAQADDLEEVAEPPAELREVEQERADERGCETRQADDHEGVADALGQEQSAQGAQRQKRVDRKTGSEQE
ncbi:MAG: hypothetical protein H0U90_03980 [Actinobacteria bacterium]|nr:hypothetical protein [Actinomycetota bacterium]